MKVPKRSSNERARTRTPREGCHPVCRTRRPPEQQARPKPERLSSRPVLKADHPSSACQPLADDRNGAHAAAARGGNDHPRVKIPLNGSMLGHSPANAEEDTFAQRVPAAVRQRDAPARLVRGPTCGLARRSRAATATRRKQRRRPSGLGRRRAAAIRHRRRPVRAPLRRVRLEPNRDRADGSGMSKGLGKELDRQLASGCRRLKR